MTPLAYLQNAVLVGAVFATYWLTESWWAWLWLLLWLYPSYPKKSDPDAIELPKIITPGRE